MNEGILKNQKNIHMAVKGSLSSFGKKKKNEFKTTKYKGIFKAIGKKSKKKGKCFLCENKNYWKKKKQDMHCLLLVESCLVVDSTKS